MSLVAGLSGVSLGIVGIAIVAVVLVVSALPLYYAVKMLGGKATLISVLLVNLAAAVIGSVFDAPLISFILLLFVYKKVFELSWIRAFGAWVLQFVVAALLVFAAFVLLGLTVL